MKCRSYANDPSAKQCSFVVTRGVRLGMQLADGETYDPFLLVLREIETGKEQIIRTFWEQGSSNADGWRSASRRWPRLIRALGAEKVAVAGAPAISGRRMESVNSIVVDFRTPVGLTARLRADGRFVLPARRYGRASNGAVAEQNQRPLEVTHGRRK